MTRAIVIAVDPLRGAFAVETEEGVCAVFCQHAGQRVAPGDILEGAVTSRGSRLLAHGDGVCAAVGDSGPITREEALQWIDGPPPRSAPTGHTGPRAD